MPSAQADARSPSVANRTREILVWLALVAAVVPALTVAVVSGYGFAVWMMQQVNGPPGPRGH